jgi:PAS domain S-box-containing protein
MTERGAKISPVVQERTRSLSLPSVYYIRRLLHQNLDHLRSVVAKGAATSVDPFCDLNATLESLYLEPGTINSTVAELEHLIFAHQSLRTHEARYRQELLNIEQKIFWYLGFKLYKTDYPAAILIVDDTPLNLKLMSMTLTQQGYQTFTASSGIEALKVIASTTIDLIMMDLVMPRIDGYEICKRLKTGDKTAHIPVIFMSAMTNSEDKVRAFKSGGADYVTKPFQMEEVFARIEYQLKIRNLQRQLEEQSDRLQKEIKERRQAEALCRDFFENALYGMFQTTPNGEYSKVNLALAQMYGYDSPESLTNTVKNIAQQIYVQPQRREEFVELMERHGSIVDFESQIYRRDGQVIWISETVRSVRDMIGEVLFYEGIVRDVTESHQTQAP